MGTVPPYYFKGQITILFPMVTQDNISQTEPCPLEVAVEILSGRQTSLFSVFLVKACKNIHFIRHFAEQV